MARDRSKKEYFLVGVPRDSLLYQLLQQDAGERDLTIAKLIPVRLMDFYEGRTSATFPVSSPGEASSALEKSDQDNASAALSAWGDDG